MNVDVVGIEGRRIKVVKNGLLAGFSAVVSDGDAFRLVTISTERPIRWKRLTVKTDEMTHGGQR